MKKLSRPDIFATRDHRRYLRDFYDFEKQESSDFSYRTFSARAGFKSPNFLKLVIEGRRNLTLKSIPAIVRAFKLSPDEAAFFKPLVLYNQAETPSEKALHFREMVRSKVFRELYPLKEAELDFYENWYCIPIREMIGDPSFREDPQWIARQLRPQITPRQAMDAISNMLLLGIIRRDANGRLVQSEKNISTGDEVQSHAVVTFHKQILELAAKSLDDVKRFERDISSVTVNISEATFHRLKELVQAFRKTLLAEAENAASTSGEQGFEVGLKSVYQIGFQLFPLTRTVHSQDRQPNPEDKAS